MEAVIIVGMVLIFSAADFFIYMKIKEKFQNQTHTLSEELKKTKKKYEELVQEVKNLKAEMQKLEGEYVKIKNREVNKIIEKKSSKPTVTEILLSEKLATSEDIKKAKDFIKNNNSPFSLVDVLVLLGKIDIQTADYVKSKISG
jgi:predicted nuclease with TOPRIM domain